MKKIAIALALAYLLSLSGIVYAHSGGTDANGGHWNHKTGEYHYHNPKGPGGNY
jgi:hypothetical protein